MKTHTDSWYASLSTRQKIWLAGTVLLMATLVAVGIVVDRSSRSTVMEALSVDMTIRELASRLGMTGQGLARDLDLSLAAPKNRPLAELGVTQADFDHARDHILSHTERHLKYFVFAALVLFGLVFLAVLGRPEGSPVKDRASWYPRAPYILCLLFAVLGAGFALGKSPNPMEGAVKVFKSMVGLYPDPWVKAAALLFFLILALVGNKLICGWACPFGALQELIYSLPFFKNIKARKISFVLTNTVRAFLFILMLLVLFGILGGKKGFVLYHTINPFNLFEPEFESAGVIGILILSLLGSLLVYRPFCLFICPFGLLSWLVERFSLYRITIDRSACTRCGACARACPLSAAKDRVNESFIQADCFSCGRCLNACPHDAINYEKKRLTNRGTEGYMPQRNRRL